MPPALSCYPVQRRPLAWLFLGEIALVNQFFHTVARAVAGYVERLCDLFGYKSRFRRHDELVQYLYLVNFRVWAASHDVLFFCQANNSTDGNSLPIAKS